MCYPILFIAFSVLVFLAESMSSVVDTVDSLDVICLDREGNCINDVGRLLFVYNNAEPVVKYTNEKVNTDLFQDVTHIFLDSLSGFKSHIIKKQDIKIDTLSHYALLIPDVEKASKILVPERFEVGYPLKLSGNINYEGYVNVYFAPIDSPYNKIEHFYITRTFDTTFTDLEHEIRWQSLGDTIYIIFEDESLKYLPYIGEAVLDENNTYICKDDEIKLNEYDFNIDSPAVKENNANINIIISDMTFKPRHSKIDLKFFDKNQSLCFKDSLEKNDTLSVIKNAHEYFSRDQTYTMRAIYRSKYAIVEKEKIFKYESNAPKPVILSGSERKKRYRMGDTLNIQWNKSIDPDIEEGEPNYRLILTERKFSSDTIIFKPERKREISIPIDKEVFEENKQYTCIVEALDSYGNVTPSENRFTFRVIGKIPTLDWEQQTYISAVNIRTVNFPNTNGYRLFRQKAQTAYLLNDHQEIILSRDFPTYLNRIDVGTAFSLFSFQGFAGTLTPRYTMYKTNTLLLASFLDFRACWFAAGIEQKNLWSQNVAIGAQTAVKLGRGGILDLSFTQNLYSKLPFVANDKISYLDDKGWSASAQFVFPEEMVPSFELPLVNFRVNPRRIPICYSYSTIADFKNHKFQQFSLSIGYLLD